MPRAQRRTRAAVAAAAAAARRRHAAARLRRPLTERGETDSFVLTTGTCRPGDAAPDLGALARPGSAIAVYMGVARAAEIEAELRAAGMPAACPVDIVASGSTARERLASTSRPSSTAGITGA